MKLSEIAYRRALRPILFKCNPETMHDLFVRVGELAGRFSATRSLVALPYGYRGRDIGKTVDGIRYRTPVLLSAGFDTDGRLTTILKSVSFGGEEVGSTTALPCEGNPRPRLTRLIPNRSIIVNKGLRNHGVDALIARLRKTPRVSDYVVGISIARTNTLASSIDAEAGIEDYAASFKKLNDADVGDYYTINISCPNTFDGETFTTPELLERLLSRLDVIPTKKPVYLKMPINLEWPQFNDLLAVAATHRIQGVITGNLNKNYKELDMPEHAPADFCGGLSGKPCKKRSDELIRKTREKYGTRFTIIGVGGIFTPDDAMDKFHAGADLVMLVSGMIFEGPGLIKKICERYEKEKYGAND